MIHMTLMVEVSVQMAMVISMVVTCKVPALVASSSAVRMVMSAFLNLIEVVLGSDTSETAYEAESEAAYEAADVAFVAFVRNPVSYVLSIVYHPND